MQSFLEKYYLWISRLSIFIVYFWFGGLKLIGYSPAHELVGSLLEKTIPFLSIDIFILILGYFEVFIGILWLIPKVEKIVLSLTVVHIITTFGPLVFLPAIAWENFLIPTLVGQYILKNFLILSLGIVIYLKHSD